MKAVCAIGCLIAGFASCAILPARAATFTLNEALATAYETNPQLAQARAALEALDQGVAQANAGWKPTVNASTSYGIQHGLYGAIPDSGIPSGSNNTRPLIGQLTVSEPVFRGGRTVAEVGRAIAQVHAGRAQLTSTEQSVLLGGVTAYMDVVRDIDSLHLNQANVRSLGVELDAVRTELAAGEVTRTDANQAEARSARAQADEAAAEVQLAASLAEYESVIGRPAETLEDAPQLPRIPATKDAALAVALAQNPNLIGSKANAHAADYDVDDAAGALLPQLSVSGQYQYLRDAGGTDIFATQNTQRIFSVTGQVNVPIYQGGGEEATVRRAKDVRAQTELGIVVAERDVRQDLDSAWQATRSAKLALAANVAQVTADQSAVDGVKLEQQAGERSVLDVLNAQQELFSAQVAVVAARHDSVVASYRLLAADGQLTARLLGLKVKIYDPREHYNDNADAWFGFDN